MGAGENAETIVREAREEDVSGIRDIFMAVYGDDYPYSYFLDPTWLKRSVFSDDILLLDHPRTPSQSMRQKTWIVLGVVAAVIAAASLNLAPIVAAAMIGAACRTSSRMLAEIAVSRSKPSAISPTTLPPALSGTAKKVRKRLVKRRCIKNRSRPS